MGTRRSRPSGREDPLDAPKNRSGPSFRPVPGRGGLAGVLLTVGAGLTLAAWLYASPPGSSPDDGFHLGSIWCAGGFHPDRCIEALGAADPEFAIAPAVLGELPCVGGDGRRPATCVNGLFASLDGQFRLIPANMTGTRAAVYYRTANLLVSEDHASAIARIRLMNAALALLVVGLTAAVAAADVRRAVVASWLIASVPLGLFLLTSLNSTAWGLIGLGTLWANAITTLRPGVAWRRSLAGVLALLGATMALGARTEAGAHLTVIVLALTALAFSDAAPKLDAVRRLRERPLVTLLGALAALAITATIIRVSAVGYLAGALSGFSSGWERLVARGISNPVLTLAAETPQLWTGGLGTWGLGWLDTAMPSAVSVPVTAAFVMLAAFGLVGASRGRSIAAGVVLTGMLALPVTSLLSVGLVVQEQLQARHYLPLLYVMLGIALVRSRHQGPLVLSRGTRLTIAAALSIGHAVALTININRYTRGLTEFLYIDTNREIAWWWGGWAPSPGTVWAVGSVAFAVAAFSALSLFRAPASDDGAAVSATRGRARP